MVPASWSVEAAKGAPLRETPKDLGHIIFGVVGLVSQQLHGLVLAKLYKNQSSYQAEKVTIAKLMEEVAKRTLSSIGSTS